MEKIKVLQVVGTMDKGGVETVVMNYYRQVYKEVEFTFVCFDNSHHIPEEEIISLGGHVFVVPHVKHFFKFNKALKSILKENHYDIIHSHINTLGVFPLRIAKKMKCPIRISHSHSTSSKKEKLRNIAKNILRKLSKKYATHYFACTEVAGRYQFGDKAFEEGKVTLVRNAIDFSRFLFNKVKREEIRQELGIKKDDYVVGTVGRLVTVKNHTFILKLAKLNPDKKFVILGEGPLEEEIKNQIKEMKLQNVILPGPKDSVNDYYNAFDVFVLPSLYEGLGMTAIEAQINQMYCVLSSHVPQDTLITGYGVYLPIEDSDLTKWNNEINKKHPRKDDLDKLNKSGYNIVEAQKTLVEIYRNLLK